MMIEKERNIIHLLQIIYEEYSSLPEQHDSDMKEFVEALHRLQHLVMIRSVRRNYSDLFPIKNNFINIEEIESIITQELQKRFNGENQ